MIEEKYGLSSSKIQEKGDFLEQSFSILKEDDFVVIGRVGERAAEKTNPLVVMLKILFAVQIVLS
jgi:hypothetical protein